MWETLCKPGATGSEGGLVLEDEEYDGECRITRERCEKYDAITCGVYRDMVYKPRELSSEVIKRKTFIRAYCYTGSYCQ